MGNTSSSGDQEAEKAAANIQQNGEAVGNEDGTKEENNIIPDASDLPNNFENSEDDKTDEDKGDTELKHALHSTEILAVSTDSLTNGEAHTFPSTNIEEGSLPHDEVLKSCLEDSRNGVKHFISSETPENEDKSQLISSEIAHADMDDQRDDSLLVEIADEMFEAVLEPEHKSVVHTLETQPISNDSENTVNICDLKKADESSEQAAGEMQIEKNTSSDDSAKAGDINVQPDIHALPVQVPTENGLLGIGMEGVNKSSLEALAFSNEKCGFDNVHDDTSFKAPENITRLSLESIPEKTSNGIELRKSPSFDFGIPFHRRSLESDQTPLLCPEKTPTRSLSLGSNANFSNSTEYGRTSLDYEAVAVEEKTIRMERSDSDISKHPLLGLFKKETNGQTQQNHVAVMKGLELNTSQENETSLTSPEGSRKVRKPRPSFFTTCICCAALTH